LKVATWNTEWAPPISKRGVIIRERLADYEPDLVCLTECHAEFLACWGGHTAVSGADWGYRKEEQWREVLLWSRQPWRDVSLSEGSGLPVGRSVVARTSTAVGDVTVMGIVIPYHFAHVRDGRRDRRPWEEHMAFLDALPAVLAGLQTRCVVLGDFNQRIPSTWVPRAARDKLRQAFSGLDIVTAASVEFGGKATIDHIACDRVFAASGTSTLSNITGEGAAISDHFGVATDLLQRQRA
jgi:endonuclease/exonuclease/phosphatase family metal-dependent hydrolase